MTTQQQPPVAPGTANEPHEEPWSPLKMGAFLARRVIVDPVREGRLRDTGWPSGLRGIVIAGLVIYLATVLIAVFSNAIRARTTLVLQLDTTIPVLAMPAIVAVLIFALTCLFTAGLHLAWWVRLPITVITVAVLSQFVNLEDGWQSTDIVPVVGVGLLVALVAIRWQAKFVWWEFATAFTIIGTTLVVPWLIQSQSSIPAVRPAIMFGGALQIFAFLWILAVPVAFLAGAAMAELTASTVTWGVTTVWQGLNVWRRRILPLGVGFLIACALFAIGRLVWGVVDGDLNYQWQPLLAGAGYIVLALALCWFVTWRADRVPSGDKALRPDPDDIPAAWSENAPALALMLGIGILGDTLIVMILNAFGVGGLVERLTDWTGSPTGSMIRSLLTALVALAWAIWLSGRGRRILPMGLASFAGLLATDVIFSRLRVTWAYEGMLAAITVAAILVLIWVVIRRDLTAERGMALVTVLLLVIVFEHREVIFEPLTALIGLAGVSSALLVGLVWRLLTDNGYTQGDSARFPQPGRVLIALANATFGVAVLALDALMGGAWIGDLGPFEGSGDRYLGVSMFVTVMYAGLSLAARGRIVRGHEDPLPPPEEPVSYEGNIFPTPRGDELWHSGWER